MNKWLTEMELEGKLVRLLPLQEKHKNELLQAASDGNLWNLWFTSVPSEETIDHYLQFANEEMQNGRALPFVVKEKNSGKIIGCTRFCNATAEHRRLEIGYTWYARSYQRTGINTECKYLLLTHAFERLDCIAVEFRTHFHNIASRKAIARIGAKQDGILRNHMIGADGIYRDTVVFSILESEWKSVKRSLEYRMNVNNP